MSAISSALLCQLQKLDICSFKQNKLLLFPYSVTIVYKIWKNFKALFCKTVSALYSQL